MEGYRFACTPLANPESIVIGQQYRFTLVDERVLRYEWAHDGIFEDRASTFAINRQFAKPEFRVEENEHQLDIITPALHLTYDKKKFSPNGLVVTFSSKQTDWGGEWRFGNLPQENLGGTARTLDGVDGRCDMGAGIISRAGYAALDDTRSMLFDGNGFVTARRSGDRVDGYLFSYGFDYKGAMSSFYAISGPQPVIPRWSLGNWWSRYHAYEQNEYLTLMDEFEAKQIPLSVAVIDMDWHVIQGDHVPHVGWTGYTWNKDLFPDPEGFAKALHDKNLKITLNDHPHAGVHSHEDLYDEMAHALGRKTTERTPILFDPASPEFMHAFLTVLHRKLEDQGCDFWWIDWQQGSYSRIPGLDPLWLLNHFHFLDQERDNSRSRSLIFSRYAGPGSHRYPVGFSGDSITTWESLEFQPEFTATASNIGYGWWSHDIGGHLNGYRDDECAARWVQLGTFSPILRLHSTRSAWMSKEPWNYRPEYMSVMQEYMQLRHRLVPYIFSLNAVSQGLPLVQPMYWSFPQTDAAYRFPNQYFFGPSLTVSPVVSPRVKRTNLAKTKVWVPPSQHVDIFTGVTYDGEREINMYRPLQYIPILAPLGSIIPLEKALVPANGCKNPEAFEVLIVVGRDCRFDIIEDLQDDVGAQRGTGQQRSIPIEYNQKSGRLTVDGTDRNWTFRFIALQSASSEIRICINDSALSETQFTIETTSQPPSTTVSLSKSISTGHAITIDLGPEPQTSILDQSQTMRDLLVDFQIEFETKDRIWGIIQSSQAITTKISRLLSLGLEEDIIGPFLELLLATSFT